MTYEALYQNILVMCHKNFTLKLSTYGNQIFLMRIYQIHILYGPTHILVRMWNLQNWLKLFIGILKLFSNIWLLVFPFILNTEIFSVNILKEHTMYIHIYSVITCNIYDIFAFRIVLRAWTMHPVTTKAEYIPFTNIFNFHFSVWILNEEFWLSSNIFSQSQWAKRLWVCGS